MTIWPVGARCVAAPAEGELLVHAQG